MAGMTVAEALAELEALGHEGVRARNPKLGAGDAQFGVRLGGVRQLATRIGSDHDLGLALWETGNLDTRLLAVLLLKPKRHHPVLRERALAIGEALGVYRDDPVSRGCTSPFAPIWIGEMVGRQG